MRVLVISAIVLAISLVQVLEVTEAASSSLKRENAFELITESGAPGFVADPKRIIEGKGGDEGNKDPETQEEKDKKEKDERVKNDQENGGKEDNKTEDKPKDIAESSSNKLKENNHKPTPQTKKQSFIMRVLQRVWSVISFPIKEIWYFYKIVTLNRKPRRPRQ
ncbi:uncharacterized protein LOC128990648 isoform X1 [Macrosteles quadrilineatus]|uniref:uncharacterized protein LOC128990648 isoform X1 n=1 Tax=Macrosteles quadrilineatus TaxID=74068 RepID=UPI0023E25C34|nr:uncharacterized protein LOC128990648 isoform X1 [Macrosteles quadrilineatus]